jgi:hypothetical protein
VSSEVWSLRQFLQSQGRWPDDLPSNDNQTLVVAGLDGCLDLLAPNGEKSGWEKRLKAPFSRFRIITVVKLR